MILPFDTIVVGAGLAGSSAALALAQQGGGSCRVCLVDVMPASALAAAGRDGRTTAVAVATADWLTDLGVWPELAPHAEPIRAIRISDDTARQFVHFEASKAGCQDPRRDTPGHAALGFIIDNGLFRRAVLDAVARHPNITVQTGQPVTGFIPHSSLRPEWAEVLLASGVTLTAALVVAADGRSSPLRTLAGIPAAMKRYPHDALTFTIAHTLPHQGIAHERFLPEGPLAVLPLPGQQASVVWMVRQEQSAALQHVAPDVFAHALQQRFGPALGTLSLSGVRHRYPLWLGQARHLASGRLVLVGEAAHALHPIAGQGLNVSLRDVAVLARLVADNRRLGLDPAQGVSDAYTTLRRPDILTMVAATDGLDRLFQVTFPPVRWARRAGLVAVQRSDRARAAFMRHAMGVSALARLGLKS
jgi:2-octaprenyl-6-methoxyphenol hydroxylase